MHWRTVGMAFTLKSLKNWSLKTSSTIPRNPHGMPVLCRHLVPVPPALFWPWGWGRREEQQDQDKHHVLERTEDNGTRCQERLGKCQAWRETRELDFVLVYLKGKSERTALHAGGADPGNVPSALGWGRVQEYSRILLHAHKARSFLLAKECLDWCRGKGWDKSRMLCSANESQTFTKVCFITATRRSTPSFYN